ncbi:Transposase, Mutator family [Methylobacterium sp. yr596]|nr:Transposase, Mutator family [Methylobacterium sp. yr596]
MNAFLDQPIEGEWPYLWIDATYVKVRQNHRIVSVAVIVAVGVNTDREEPGAGKPHARICEGKAEWPSYSTTTRTDPRLTDETVSLLDVCGKNPTPLRFRRSGLINGLLTGGPRGTLADVEGICPILRLPHTIAVLLLAAAALVLMVWTSAFAGSAASADAVVIGHTQAAKADLAAAEAEAPQIGAVPCDHARISRHVRTGHRAAHNPRQPCCNAAAAHGLQPRGTGSLLEREARPVVVARLVAGPLVPSPHLNRIERPPRQG